MAIRKGTIYLLCFDRPFGHAKHYLGWASDLDIRLAAHDRGEGANLLRHVRKAGITWKLVRTWRRTDRHLERRLKNRGGKSRLCPRCKQLAAFMAGDGEKLIAAAALGMGAIA